MHMEEEKDLEQPVPETRQGGEVKVQKVEFHPLPLDSTASPRQERAPAFDKVKLKLTAELGKTRIKIRDFINLEEGSLLELNRPADEDVLLLANEAPFARGEIVVINERFGVRIISFMHERQG